MNFLLKDCTVKQHLEKVYQQSSTNLETKFQKQNPPLQFNRSQNPQKKEVLQKKQTAIMPWSVYSVETNAPFQINSHFLLG